MFQSHDAHAEFHAIARSISGGPIYITDQPGKENANILRRLAFSDGRLLMPDEPGQVTRDCLLRDVALEAVPLKVFGLVHRPGLTSGMIAAFNVNKMAPSVEGIVSAADVAGSLRTRSGEPVLMAVYQRSSDKAHLLSEEKSILPFRLDEFGFDLFTLTPINRGVGVFGLLDKYLGPAAVFSQTWDGNRTTVRLREAGDFGAWLSQPPGKVEIDKRALPPLSYRYKDGLLRIPLSSFGDKKGAREITITLASR
jgi:hypothetical protein